MILKHIFHMRCVLGLVTSKLYGLKTLFAISTFCVGVIVSQPSSWPVIFKTFLSISEYCFFYEEEWIDSSWPVWKRRSAGHGTAGRVCVRAWRCFATSDSLSLSSSTESVLLCFHQVTTVKVSSHCVTCYTVTLGYGYLHFWGLRSRSHRKHGSSPCIPHT